MTLVIRLPDKHIAERLYICKVIFEEFLGVEYRTEFYDSINTEITMQDDSLNKTLYIEDAFLSIPDSEWLNEGSMPIIPLKVWDLSVTPLQNFVVMSKLPVIYGADPSNPDFFRVNKNHIKLGLDILGSAFFMLTRYEELLKPDRDEHGRFPASASLAYQEGFLDRPIINEYLEILWWCLKYLWPRLERKKRLFRVSLSHDVDSPYAYAFQPLYKNLIACGGDIVKRKSISLATSRFLNWLIVKNGNIEKDPNNTFNYIMDISEKYNIKSIFNFQVLNSSQYDANYSLDHPYMQYLLKLISNRGHEIGLHPGYNTIRDSEETKAAFLHLKSACDKLGIKQDQWGGRQHYLRWQAPYTWQNYEDAGFDYDNTLSYADHAGFRCGICYDYSVFNLLTRSELKLKERPLVVMECSILENKYMGFDYSEAFDYIAGLINNCSLYNGVFSLLWHNNRLKDEMDLSLYGNIVKY